MIDMRSIARFFNKIVTVSYDTGKDEDGTSTFKTIDGRVVAASDAGLAVRHRSTTVIIDLHNIIEIEETGRPRRRKVIRRFVRMFGPDDNVKQHLADRHGVLVSVLNAADETTARDMHDGYDHRDLGHQHGEGPAELAAERLDELDAAPVT